MNPLFCLLVLTQSNADFCGRGTSWSEEEQTCVAVSEVKARRAAGTPSIRSIAEDLVVQVNDGKHITFKVGDNEFNVDELPTSLRGYSDGTLAAIRLGFEQGFARCAAAEEAGQAAVNTLVSKQLGALSSEITALKALITSNTEATATNAECCEKTGPLITALDTAIKTTNKDVLKVGDTVAENVERADEIEKAATALTKVVGALDLQLNPPCEDAIKWVRFTGTTDPKVLGSKGVASVKRTKKGTYRVTFENEYTDIKYATAMMSQRNNNDNRVFAHHATMSGSGFLQYQTKTHVDIETRRTQTTAHIDDYDVIINFVAVRTPDDDDQTDCSTGISEWSGVRYTSYTPKAGWAKGAYLVEKGLAMDAGAYGGGQKVTLKPGMDGPNDYVVAGCVSGNNDGAYMGLEGNHVDSGSAYNVYEGSRFALAARGDNNAHQLPGFASVLVFTHDTVKASTGTIKMVSFTDGNDNKYADEGTASVKKVSSGTYSIKWTKPFKNANYVVVGLANMWCSGGQGLSITDGWEQTAGETRVTQTHPYNGYTPGDYGTDCTFITAIAIGE